MIRVLIVAMANSIHTMRWAEQFKDDDGVQIYLFPSTIGSGASSDHAWSKLPLWAAGFSKSKRIALVHVPLAKLNIAFHYILKRLFQERWREYWLKRTIRRLKPDIIHTLEFQHAGYLCLKVKPEFKKFPTWIATNWGSDIYLFSRLKGHEAPIKGILQQADFYSAECARDYKLAEDLGMTAKALPVIPNAGGLHLDELRALRNRVQTSDRNLILIKGYQMVFGRAMTAVQALEPIAEELKKRNIKVCIFSVTPDIEIAIELSALKTGLDIEAIPIAKQLSHQRMLELHAQARAYIGVSISDGISTSMLEAMALGAFPIQTCTSCANEWIEHNKTGLIAQAYDDPAELSRLIYQAMTDDDLVNKAAAINWETVTSRLDYQDVSRVARGFYEQAYQKSQTNAL